MKRYSKLYIYAKEI